MLSLIQRQSSRHNWEYSGKIYPNGEFSLGQYFHSKDELLKSQIYQKQYDEWYKRNQAWQNKAIEDKDGYLKIQYVPTAKGHPSYPDRGREEAVSFSLSYLTNCHKIPNPSDETAETAETSSLNCLIPYQISYLESIPSARTAAKPPVPRARRGLKGISSTGRKMVRNGTHLMTEDYGKSRLGMLTLTLPNLDAPSMAILAKDHSEIVRKFNQSLKRKLKREGAPTDIVGVTELQEKRYQKYGQVCFHLHIIYVADKSGKGDYYISFEWFRKKWAKILKNQLEKAIEEKQITAYIDKNTMQTWDEKVRIECSKIKKNAGAYISKYLSKGGQIISEIAEKEPDKLPSNWWHMFHDLRRTIKYFTIPIGAVIGDMIDAQWRELVKLGICKKIKFCPIELQPRAPDIERGFQLRAYTGVFTELGMELVQKLYVDKFANKGIH